MPTRSKAIDQAIISKILSKEQDFGGLLHVSLAFLYEAIRIVDFGQGPNIIDITGDSVLNQHKEQNRQMSAKIQSQNEELKELNESLEKTVKKRTRQLEQAVTHLKGMSERLKQSSRTV